MAALASAARWVCGGAGCVGLPDEARGNVGDLLVARQRPGTDNGICFMLLEDEHGTVNLVVPPDLYERERLVVRTEPLILAGGRLERFASGGGAINVLVRELRVLDAPDRPRAEVHDFSPLDDRELERARLESWGATGTDDFRAVAPSIMSFGRGRRR